MKYLVDLTLANNLCNTPWTVFWWYAYQFQCSLNVHSSILIYIELLWILTLRKLYACASHMETHRIFLVMDHNYKAIGERLCSFLLQVGTVTATWCAKNYMILLSLYDEKDGFCLLQWFIFKCSPHLGGTFRKFWTEIMALTLSPIGETFYELYHQYKMISTDINLAKDCSGADSLLMAHYLSLHHSTKAGELSILPLWK